MVTSSKSHAIIPKMSNEEFSIDSLLELSSLENLDPAEAIDALGTWIEAAGDAQHADVLRHLAVLAGTIETDRASESNLTLLDYYLANLWGSLKYMAGPHQGGSWDWEQPEAEQEIIHLRRAIGSAADSQLPDIRRCQFYTNLGNAFSTIGRFAEAIQEWSLALAIEPQFGMARGNRAICLWRYAREIYDPNHAVLLVREAWRDLDIEALNGLEPGAAEYFQATRQEIEVGVAQELLQQGFDLNQEVSHGDTEDEQDYRQWCLKHCLFLNPLNDLGPLAIANQDVLTAPPIVVSVGEGPKYHDFFNQLKQEYCSARWTVYEALSASSSHFSDRDVLLYDTLDYPSYGLSTERL